MFAACNRSIAKTCRPRFRRRKMVASHRTNLSRVSEFIAGVLTAIVLAGSVRAADREHEPIVSRIQREPVESTALAEVGYSRRLHALEIKFHDGLIYRWEEVPLPVYRELMAAESKARFYNKSIRGKYHCLRVRPPRD